VLSFEDGATPCVQAIQEPARAAAEPRRSESENFCASGEVYQVQQGDPLGTLPSQMEPPYYAGNFRFAPHRRRRGSLSRTAQRMTELRRRCQATWASRARGRRRVRNYRVVLVKRRAIAGWELMWNIARRRREARPVVRTLRVTRSESRKGLDGPNPNRSCDVDRHTPDRDGSMGLSVVNVEPAICVRLHPARKLPHRTW